MALLTSELIVSNGQAMLSVLQTRKLTRYFNAFDSDRNGVLERSDFEKHIRRVVAAGDLTEDSPAYRWVYARWMKVWSALAEGADANADGCVDLAEWLAYHDAQIQAKVPYWRELDAGGVTSVEYLFNLIDLDADGQISWKEYSLFLRAYDVPSDLHEGIFSQLDLNGDGMLTRDEWIVLTDEFYGDDPYAPGNWLFGPF